MRPVEQADMEMRNTAAFRGILDFMFYLSGFNARLVNEAG